MLSHDLDRLTTQFVQGLLGLLRSATVDDLVMLQARSAPPRRAEPVRPARERAEAPPARRATPARAPERKPKPPPPRAAKAAPPVQAPKKSAKKAAPERAPKKRDARSVVDQVMSALENEPDGLGSEALQRQVALASTELRVLLAQLVEEGRLIRHGQARGTRYQIPTDVSEQPAEVSSPEEEAPFPMPAVLPKLPMAAEPPPPEPVPVEVLNELRGHLASSGTPLLIGELETLSGLARPRLRQALDQLIELGLLIKQGRGLGVRYQLGGQPAEEPVPEAATPAPPGRVIRRRARETEA